MTQIVVEIDPDVVDARATAVVNAALTDYPTLDNVSGGLSPYAFAGDRRRLKDKMQQMIWHAQGIAAHVATNPKLRFLEMGDSIAYLMHMSGAFDNDARSVTSARDYILASARGRIGFINCGPTVGESLSGGAVAFGPPSTFDFTKTPFGNGISMPSVGSRMNITTSGATYRADTIIIFYWKGPGGGSFKVQTATSYAGTYTDVPGYDNVSTADSVPGTGVLVIDLGTWTNDPNAYAVRVETVSAGTAGVWITGAGMYTDRTRCAIWINARCGGWAGGAAVTDTPTAVWQQMFAGLAPDAFSIMCDDRPSNGLEAFLDMVEPYIDSVSPFCTKFYGSSNPREAVGDIGLWPSEQAKFYRARCLTNNANFFDFNGFLRDFTQLNNFGGGENWNNNGADGIHLNAGAYVHCMTHFVDAMGIADSVVGFSMRPIYNFSFNQPSQLRRLLLTSEDRAGSAAVPPSADIRSTALDVEIRMRRAFIFQTESGAERVAVGLTEFRCPMLRVGTANSGGPLATGTGDPTVTSGTGAPSASQPDGSVYLRKDASNAVTGIYQRRAGSWCSVVPESYSANDITSGTLSNARLSSDVARRDQSNTINGTVTSIGCVLSPTPFFPGAGSVWQHSSNQLCINTGSAGFTINDDLNSVNLITISTAGNLAVRGLIGIGVYTVATLPSASSNAGRIAQVTDSNSTTNGTTVAGGGANRVPVFSNGANWIIK